MKLFFSTCEQLETRIGFHDSDLIKLVKKIPLLDLGIRDLVRKGFRYCGDTKSDSKAFTDVHKKQIYIGREKSSAEACLSLTYEMTNAKNGERIKAVHSRYLYDRSPTRDKAEAYANAILGIEAEAVFNRSIVAMEVGLEEMIKNKAYLGLARANRGNSRDAIAAIFSEMQANGKVHNGKKRAFDHYVDQYFEYNS